MKCLTHTDTHTDVGGEALGSVAGKFTDNLEVVKLGLQPSEELLAGRHQVGVQLEEVSEKLPQLLIQTFQTELKENVTDLFLH